MSYLALDLTFHELQTEVERWAERNFDGREPSLALLGVQEELGELCHAHLKGLQGIRHTPEEIQAMKVDAVADVIIYLADYCAQSDIDLQTAVENTLVQVLQRDWRKDPVKGVAV